MHIKKVVITGGPSTGKTSVIENLEKKGFRCVHELIRSMTSQEIAAKKGQMFKTNPILSVSDPAKFNQQLLQGRIEQYKSVNTIDAEVVFFDRGIPDVHAYMNCFQQAYDKVFEEPGYLYTYDSVLLMPPWREIHSIDEERFESFEESLRINEYLQKTYESFGYKVNLVPKGSVDERTNFILALLNLY